MLGKVTPGNLVNFLGREINYSTSSTLKSNSIVLLKILEKIGANYKVLINGKIYQASLPVLANQNETLLAKVITSKPLKLTLNNLFPENLLSNSSIDGIISLLEIEKSETARKLIKSVLEEGKHLSKEKLEQTVAFASKNNLPLDFIQLSFLVNLFWQEGNKKKKELLKSIPKIFDLTFTQLAEYISGYAVSDNFVQSANISTFLNNVFTISPAPKGKLQFRTRVEKISSFLGAFNKEFDLYPLSKLRTYLLKYILQKSVFREINFHPDFYFVFDKNSIVINYLKYQKSSDRAFNTVLQLNTNFNDASLENLKAGIKFTNLKYFVILSAKKKEFNNLYILENNLKAALESKFATHINVTHQIESKSSKIDSGNIDFMA